MTGSTACSPATNDDAADAELVVLATVWDAAVRDRRRPRRAARGQDRDLDGERPGEGAAVSSSPWCRRPARSPPRCRPWRPTPGSSPRSTSSRPPRSPTSTTTSRATCSSSATTTRAHDRPRPDRRHPRPARARRRLARQRARHRDVLRRAPHRQPPTQGRGHAPARRDRPPPHHHAMTIQIFDTAQRAVVPFDVGPVVRMYVCGITPYDSTHLGHAATYLTYDLLIRRLEELGHEVRMVRNVTDVDDSILPEGPRARRALPRARRGGAGALPLRHGGARHASAARRARARPSRSTA